jgi:flagellar basal body-associated protein FliL
MNGFIVTAPVKVEKIAFIAVDLSIDFIDVSTDPIKDYEPFFRNIIYEVLKKALVLESELQVNEADLKKMIIEALNDALAEGAVDNVNFTSFKLS